MRVLCTTTGSPSHGRAQLPLLRALAAAGHEVRVLTTSDLVPLFRHDDFQVEPSLPDFSPGALLGKDGDDDDAAPGSALAALADLKPEEQREALMPLMAKALSGPLAKLMYEAIAPVAREYRPHLALRDGMDLGTVLIGEELGIPHLPTPSGANNLLDPATLLDGLNEVRAELGLPIQDDPLSVVAHGRVDYVPAAFSFARHMPAPLAYRQTVEVERSSILPDWFAELPTDRPLVWAAIGTALPMIQKQREEGKQEELPFEMPDPVKSLRIILDAAAELTECTVVVATSGLPVSDAGLPSHVRLTEWLPQPLVLETADLFLTHGGFNSVREALRTATPMVVLPHFGDQFANAERVAELGFGRGVTDFTPDAVAAACRAVLADERAGQVARRARLEMLTLPDVATAVTDLERLAGVTT
ncbi:glycosyltransferase [Streptomyces sp. LP05-1]|uniref:Glycosyltransferase n=1 Tax=Streptomyces pyxinae TaxID=2970734 RepID=A0ABT2CBI2_9ACTN|nr:glycosyltransferase [Streptomyces sp. LP05-1]MCS0634768.1 glycosyltransferase [Streptomyces sp. LP05-1]